jgi:hypothetical protein
VFDGQRELGYLRLSQPAGVEPTGAPLCQRGEVVLSGLRDASDGRRRHERCYRKPSIMGQAKGGVDLDGMAAGEQQSSMAIPACSSRPNSRPPYPLGLNTSRKRALRRSAKV